MAQVRVVAAEIYPEDTQVVAMLRSLDGCRNAVAFFSPLPDDLVMRCGQAAAFPFGFVLGGGYFLGVLQRLRGIRAAADLPALGSGSQVVSI
ncbi:hypothetical protein D9M70_611370 [compost metagenome]